MRYADLMTRAAAAAGDGAEVHAEVKGAPMSRAAGADGDGATMKMPQTAQPIMVRQAG